MVRGDWGPVFIRAQRPRFSLPGVFRAYPNHGAVSREMPPGVPFNAQPPRRWLLPRSSPPATCSKPASESSSRACSSRTRCTPQKLHRPSSIWMIAKTALNQGAPRGPVMAPQGVRDKAPVTFHGVSEESVGLMIRRGNQCMKLLWPHSPLR